MRIDFSPLNETINHMVFQLAIILIVPLIAGILIKWILRSIKLPKSIANFGAVIVLLFVFYKTLMIVLG